MTKFLLISEDNEKENIIRETCPSDEIIVSTDETLIFDTLKVEEPDIVIIDGDLTSLDLKSVCRKIKQYPVITLLILGEVKHNKDIMHNHYDYLRELHTGNDVAYMSERERRREQYIKPLKDIQ